jgi:hypothetical protein
MCVRRANVRFLGVRNVNNGSVVNVGRRERNDRSRTLYPTYVPLHRTARLGPGED